MPELHRLGGEDHHDISLGKGEVLHGIDIINSDYLIEYASRPMLRKYGALDGKTCYEIYMDRKRPCKNCPARTAIKTMKPARIEFRGKKGKHFLISATPVKNRDGSVSAIETIVDVTERVQGEEERKRAAKALQASEEKFKTIFENASDQIIYMDEDGIILDVNDKIEDIFGYRREEVIGKNFAEIGFFGPEELKKSLESYSRTMTGRGPGIVEFRARRKDGSPIFVEASTRLIPKAGGGNNLLAIVRDITERKSAEDKIEQLSFIVESVHDAVIMTNTDREVVYVNRAAEVMLGYTAGEMLGTRAAVFFEGIPGNPPDLAHHISEQARLRPWEGEILESKKDGTVFPIELRLDVVRDAEGAIVGYVGFSRDISDRKRAEEALKESKEKYRLLYENSHDAIVLADVETGILLDANREAERLFCYEKDEIIGMHQSKLHPPEEAGHYWEKFRKHVLSGRAEDFEAEIITRAGKRVPVLISAAVMELGGKDVIQGIFRDITEQRKAEEELRKFKTISDRANYGTAIADLGGNLLYVNEDFARMHGYEPDELAGKHLSLLHTEDQMVRVDELNEVLVREGDYSAKEIWHKRRDGTVFPALMNATVIEDENGQPLFMSATAIDISERKQAEERLAKLNRCFLSLGPDPHKNIEAIVRAAGEILGGACMLYNRLEKERGMLCTWGSWHEPPGYDREDAPEGHICYDVIKKGKGEPVVIEDLTGTKYVTTDPNVDKYKLMSYLGVPVRAGSDVVGSFCLCDVVKRKFTDDEIRIITMLARAIGIEDERLQVEKELSQSKIITDTIDEALILFNMDSTVSFVNPAYERVTGRTREDLIGLRADEVIQKTVPEEERDLVARSLQKALHGEEQPLSFTRLKHASGGETPIELGISHVRDKDGKAVQIVAVITDIAERKKAEEALSARLRYEETLAHTSRALLAESEGENALEEALHHLLAGSGASRVYIFENFEERDGELFMRQTHEVCAPGVKPEIDNTLLQHLPYRPDFRRWAETLSRGLPISGAVEGFPGSERSVLEPQDTLSILVLPIWVTGRWYGFIGFDETQYRREWSGEDIRLLQTAAEMVASHLGRRQFEKALKESSLKLAALAEEQRILLEHTRDFVYRHDRHGIFTYLSPSVEQITGYSIEDWKGHYTKFMTDNPINEKVVEHTEETLRTGKESPPYLVEIRRRDGRPILLEVNERAYFQRGKIAGIIGVARDVTKREKMEEALRESEERMRAIINTVPGVVYTAMPDKNKTKTLVSASITEMIGYTPEEMLASPSLWESLILSEDRRKFEKAIAELLETKNRIEMEYRVVHKEGHMVYVLDRASPILDENNNISMIEGIMVDISERKKLQEMMIQTDKLSAIGEMVAGIAHELNNPLGIISGHIQLLLARVKDRAVRSRLKKMETHVQRGTKIIQNLLSFARKGELETEAGDINATILEALENVRSEIPAPNIRIVKELEPSLPQLTFDRQKMQIVFINIIKNAFQALIMQGGKGEVRLESCLGDGSVIVRVKDTGPGVETPLTRYIIDPFFTTKKVGKGTGLGLSIAYGIVKEHGGTIRAANQDGGGFMVTIVLPVHAESRKRA